MSSRPPPEWHMEARKLHAEGLGSAEIAKRLGRVQSTVSWVLDVNGDRAKTRARQKRFRAAAEVMKAEPPASPPENRTMRIARLFAAGDIDRAEMTRRLRGGEG